MDIHKKSIVVKGWLHLWETRTFHLHSVASWSRAVIVTLFSGGAALGSTVQNEAVGAHPKEGHEDG